MWRRPMIMTSMFQRAAKNASKRVTRASSYSHLQIIPMIRKRFSSSKASEASIASLQKACLNNMAEENISTLNNELPLSDKKETIIATDPIKELHNERRDNQYLSETPKIVVIGVGGAGGNAINNMISTQTLNGVEFLVANTDAQHLNTTLTSSRIQLGQQGLGCGANPALGAAAATNSLPEIKEKLRGANMLFVAAGMGGGTGTGAAPVIAKAAKDAGILTVAVVTKPFRFEGKHRLKLAEAGIEELNASADAMIVIPNQNLFQMSTPQTSLIDAFRMADDVLLAGVKNITDLMVMPGLVNLDFADVKSVMTGMGNAMMGTGEASGPSRALDAAELALANPLLGNVSVKGASGLLVSVTGGPDMTLFEVDDAAARITQEVTDPMANIIFGSTYDCTMEGKIRVSVLASGVSNPEDNIEVEAVMV